MTAGVPAEMAASVRDIIKNMGYSKRLAGISPKTLEGKIVSDADMLDSIGAIGLVRAAQYNSNRLIFDKNVIPDENISAAEYLSLIHI